MSLRGWGARGITFFFISALANTDMIRSVEHSGPLVELMPHFLDAEEVHHVIDLCSRVGLMPSETGITAPRFYISPDYRVSKFEVHPSGYPWWTPRNNVRQEDPVLRNIEDRIAVLTGIDLHDEEEMFHLMRLNTDDALEAGQLLGYEMHLDTNQASLLTVETFVMYLQNPSSSVGVVFPCHRAEHMSLPDWEARRALCDSTADMAHGENLFLDGDRSTSM